MIKKEEIIKIATEIRSILLEEFPDNLDLKHQCKRASILFDIYCKNNNIKSYPVSGFITNKGDINHYNRGHVWNLIYINKKKFILDLTLTQFKNYLRKDVPDILLEEEKLAKINYNYVNDKFGKYEYKHGDVRYNLIEKVNNIKF